jgi:hypothetical protein
MSKNALSLLAKILFITAASFVGTEFLTGSTPVLVLTLHPARLFLPVLVSFIFYGAGVLLAREATVIWRKGWLSILSFGAAYAIIEEGIWAKTWFTPKPPTLYGRWHGVNWSFGLAETVVEAIFSIAIPIALSRMAFPGSESERWFGKRSLTLVGIIYLCDTTLGFLTHKYTQPLTQLPLALLMTAAFLGIGYGLPSPKEQKSPTGVLASPRTLALFYFGTTLVIFSLTFVQMLPDLPHPLSPIVSAILAVSLVILIFRFLHKRSLSDQQLFAVVVGMASVMFLWSIFPARGRGAPLGVLMYLGLLAFVWRRMKIKPGLEVT